MANHEIKLNKFSTNKPSLWIRDIDDMLVLLIHGILIENLL